MNDDQLRTLLQRSAGDLHADPAVADRAWRTAVQQDRRQRFAVVAGAAAAVALVTVLIVNPPSFNRAVPPATTPSSSPASTTESVNTPPEQPSVRSRESISDVLRRISQPPWDDVDVAALPMLKTKLPATLDPRGQEASLLSADPVDAALAVAQPSGPALDIRVLGDDGRWRLLDTPGLEPIFSDGSVVSMVQGSPISPDGTQVALPQPGGLVVIDVTTGSSRTFDVSASEKPPWLAPATQWSPDGAQIMIGPATSSWRRPLQPGRGWLVDVLDGDVQSVRYDPTRAAFTLDGTVIELRRPCCGFSQLWRYEGNQVADRVPLEVWLYDDVTPVIGDVIAVSRVVRAWEPPKGPDDQDGILVLEPDTGRPLAELPMRAFHMAENAKLYGWLDDETLVFSVWSFPGQKSLKQQRVLVAWNYRSGQLSRLTEPATFPGQVDLALAVQRLR